MESEVGAHWVKDITSSSSSCCSSLLILASTLHTIVLLVFWKTLPCGDSSPLEIHQVYFASKLNTHRLRSVCRCAVCHWAFISPTMLLACLVELQCCSLSSMNDQETSDFGFLKSCHSNMHLKVGSSSLRRSDACISQMWQGVISHSRQIAPVTTGTMFQCPRAEGKCVHVRVCVSFGI